MLSNCGVWEDSCESLRQQDQTSQFQRKYSLDGLMLKLNLQSFGHLMRRPNWFEKTLMLGKIEDRRRVQERRDGWMISLTQWTWVWASPGRWWGTGSPGMLQSMGARSWTQLSGWTATTTWVCVCVFTCINIFLAIPHNMCHLNFSTRDQISILCIISGKS